MDYYNEIKKELVNNEVNRAVKNYSINRNDLNTYYNVGKMLSEAGKHYGEGIIQEISKRLTDELKVKYDSSSLNKMKKFLYWLKNWRHCRQICHIVIMLNCYHMWILIR